MKKTFNITSGVKLLFATVLLAAIGCSQPAPEPQATETVSKETAEPAKPSCEVEKKGQQIKNKLLVSIENMETTMDKLHEVLEEHNHTDITEHASEVEGYMLKLMTQSVYLPIKNFNATHAISVKVLETSTEYSWANKYHSFAENAATFDKLEQEIEGLKSEIKEMDNIPDLICETEKGVAKKGIYFHLYAMNIYLDQVDRAVDKNCLPCAADYCQKLEDFVKTFREAITNIASSDFTTLNRTLGDLEHDVHEMKEKAEEGHKEDLHHTHETAVRQMERLKEEVGEIR